MSGRSVDLSLFRGNSRYSRLLRSIAGTYCVYSKCGMMLLLCVCVCFRSFAVKNILNKLFDHILNKFVKLLGGCIWPQLGVPEGIYTKCYYFSEINYKKIISISENTPISCDKKLTFSYHSLKNLECPPQNY